MSKRILLVNTLYYPDIAGGAEIYLKLKAESLQKAGYLVNVLVTTERGSIKNEIINEVSITRIPIKNVYWHYTNKKPNKYLRFLWHLLDVYNPFIIGDIKREIEKFKPDVVFLHNVVGWSASIISVFTKLKIPTYFVIHDQYLRCPKTNMFKGGINCKSQCTSCKILRLPHEKLTQKVTGFIAPSAFILNDFKDSEYFKGVGNHLFYYRNEIKITKKPVFVSPKNPIVFGFLGSLVKAKGIELLIDEFKKLPTSNELFIAGKGDIEYVQFLKNKTIGFTNIYFLGFSSPSDLFAKINVLIVPSIWSESFGLVSVEALANSVPVIANNIGGIPEIIKNEENGLLVNLENENELLNAMKSLIDNTDLLNTLIKQANNSVQKFLNVDLIAEEYETIIEAL